MERPVPLADHAVAVAAAGLPGVEEPGLDGLERERADVEPDLDVVVLRGVVAQQERARGEAPAVPVAPGADLDEPVAVADEPGRAEVVVRRVVGAGRDGVADAGGRPALERPERDEPLVLRHARLGEKAPDLAGGADAPGGRPRRAGLGPPLGPVDRGRPGGDVEERLRFEGVAVARRRRERPGVVVERGRGGDARAEQPGRLAPQEPVEQLAVGPGEREAAARLGRVQEGQRPARVERADPGVEPGQPTEGVLAHHEPLEPAVDLEHALGLGRQRGGGHGEGEGEAAEHGRRGAEPEGRAGPAWRVGLQTAPAGERVPDLWGTWGTAERMRGQASGISRGRAKSCSPTHRPRALNHARSWRTRPPCVARAPWRVNKWSCGRVRT